MLQFCFFKVTRNYTLLLLIASFLLSTSQGVTATEVSSQSLLSHQGTEVNHNLLTSALNKMKVLLQQRVDINKFIYKEFEIKIDEFLDKRRFVLLSSNKSYSADINGHLDTSDDTLHLSPLSPLKIPPDVFKATLADFPLKSINSIDEADQEKPPETLIPGLIEKNFGTEKNFKEHKLFKIVLHTLTHEIVPDEVFPSEDQKEEFAIDFTHNIMAGDKLQEFHGEGWNYLAEGVLPDVDSDFLPSEGIYTPQEYFEYEYLSEVEKGTKTYSEDCSDLHQIFDTSTSCSISYLNINSSARVFIGLIYSGVDQYRRGVTEGVFKQNNSQEISREFNDFCRKTGYDEAATYLYNPHEPTGSSVICWDKDLIKGSFVSLRSLNPKVPFFQSIEYNHLANDREFTIFHPHIRFENYALFPVLVGSDRKSLDRFCQYFGFSRANPLSLQVSEKTYTGAYFSSRRGDLKLIQMRDQSDFPSFAQNYAPIKRLTCIRSGKHNSRERKK